MPKRFAVPDNYLECRLYHQWIRQQGEANMMAYSWKEIHLRCVNCQTIRVDSFDVTGRLNGRRYVYPEDYHIASEDMPTRDEIRARFGRVIL